MSYVQTSRTRLSTAVEIERMLETQIRSGLYPEDSQLPTVRELAEKLDVNKNTIVRAYQSLARKGYLELIRGRGAFVRQNLPADGMGDSRWLARLDQLLQEARLQSLDRDTVLHQVQSGIQRVFGPAELQVAFVECNTPDIEQIGGELGSTVEHPMQGVLLADLLARPVQVAGRYDLIVTTFFHLGQVTRALGPGARSKVVGVNTMPTHAALLNIARLQADVIGLVCDLPSTVDNLAHIIQTYHPAAITLPALIDDMPRLEQVLAQADAIVVTRSAHDRLQARHPRVPVIMVTFTLDQQSIDFLRTRIEETRP